MPILKNSGQSLNLASFRTWIVDTDPTSRYFRLSQIPDTLTAGKNAFLINGSPELVQSTTVKVELIDANGKAVFLHPIQYYTEGMARVMSIEVYADTAPGIATLTILGHIKQDADGNLPPSEFANAYNVKWTKQILIAPDKINATPIRVYKYPTLTASELLLPVFVTTGSVSATLTSGSATLTAYPSNPALLSTAINRVDITGTAATCSRYMVGGQFSTVVHGTPFTSSVTSVLDSTAFIVADNFPITGSLTTGAYSVVYTASVSPISTSETRSYANLLLNGLKTFSGQIARARIYAKPTNQTTDYNLLSDIQLAATELTVTASNTTGDARIRIGSFTDQTFVNTYWTAGSVSGSALTTGVNPTYDSTQQLDSIHFVTGSLITNPTSPNYFMGTKTPINFQAGNEYYASASLVCLNTNGVAPRMDVYLSGSAFPPSADSVLGVKIGSVILNANQTRASVQLSANFIATNSGSANLNFVIYSGDWYVSNVGVFSAYDFGFNPDEAHIIVPLYGYRTETLQFKVDLFDSNSNLLPIPTTTFPVYVDGGNYTVRGQGNYVDGVFTIGSSGGSGITLTGMGYTGSTGPVANLPAMYIGQGTYNNPNTPFFVASGSTGHTLFSLGNQLTWDGTTLLISGSIQIDTGSMLTRIQNLETTSSALKSNQAVLFTSTSTLDSRIFTDAAGNIVRAPTGSVSGLYLGSTNLGYFDTGMWKTYMSNNGHFFLTGSDGSPNYLSWDGSNLQIAGSINIVAGQTYTLINNISGSASGAGVSASAANAAAQSASLSAAAASASAQTAAGSASIANTNAQNAALSASNVQANLVVASSSLAANIFTDSTGKINKTPSPTLAGLYLGSTYLGYYSQSAWQTYMDNQGKFFLTGSNGSNNYLSWDGNALQIAGNINIVSGVTYTLINQTTASANTAQASASVAQTAAGLAQSSASAAQTVAGLAQSSASIAITSASNAQNSANTANTNAQNAALSASNVQTNLVATSSSLAANIFTDATGKINKTPSPSAAGLYLGSTYLGYYSQSAWQTYMDNQGKFFLTGSNGSNNYLSWDGNALQIAGNINIVSGVTYTAINNATASANSATASANSAVATANSANTTSSNALTVAGVAQNSASTALTSANIAQLTASGALSSASSAISTANSANTTSLNANNTALAVSASLVTTSSSLAANIFTDSTGKINKTPSPSAAGLYLGSTYLGYYSQSAWQTYMDNQGKFFLTGSNGSNNYLSWDGNALQIAGNINIVSGVTYTTINNATASANQATASANSAVATANAATASANTAVSTATSANTTSSNALTAAGIAQNSASGALTSASYAQSTASNALTSASTAVTTANTANTTATNTSASLVTASSSLAARITADSSSLAGQIVVTSSSLAANIFTDTTGRINKTPSPTLSGLFLGSTYLGYYSGSAWATYMDNQGKFFLTGSNGSNNYLSWDGNALQIAGNINIVSGVTYTTINNATASANQATASANSAIATANAATASANSAVSTATSANTTSNNALTVAGTAQNSASVALTSASIAQVTASGALTSASNAVSTANTANTTANTANTTATNTSASLVTASSSLAARITADSSSLAGQIVVTSSSLAANIFTDTTGKINKTPSPTLSGLFLGSTYLGYYSGSAWATYMDSQGKFFLTGSNATSNYLSWDGTNLQIAGNIQIVSGVTYTTINNATANANQATASANTAIATANAATASANSAVSTANTANTTANTANTTATGAQTTAASAQTTASGALTSASIAQATASGALTSASNAVGTANTANTTATNTSASLVTTSSSLATRITNDSSSLAAAILTTSSSIGANIFTDSTGKIVKTPNTGSAGLYLGATYLGYYSGSAWQTYMSNTGNFYLTGSNATSNYLTWDGTNLVIAGAIVITSGQTYNTINSTTATANAAQSTASQALNTANTTSTNLTNTSASFVTSNANTSSSIGTTITNTSSSFSSSLATQSGSVATSITNTSSSLAANIVSTSSSLAASIFTTTTGRVVKTPSPSTAGLYLGNANMGYYNGSSWQTYMDNAGRFFLTGTGGNSLYWDGVGVLAITGSINSTGGYVTGNMLITSSGQFTVDGAGGQSTGIGSLRVESKYQNGPVTSSIFYNTSAIYGAYYSIVSQSTWRGQWKIFTNSPDQINIYAPKTLTLMAGASYDNPNTNLHSDWNVTAGITIDSQNVTITGNLVASGVQQATGSFTGNVTVGGMLYANGGATLAGGVVTQGLTVQAGYTFQIAGNGNKMNWYSSGYENWYAGTVVNNTSFSIGSATLADILTFTNGGSATLKGNFNITGDFVGNHIIKLGQGVSGYGGQVQVLDDSATLRWAFGLLGSTGYRDFAVYDAVNATTRFNINYSNGQAQFTTGAGSDIAIQGSATQGTQIQLGNGSVISSIGTTYSGGWGYMTYNAFQTNKGTDSWMQNYAPATSLLLSTQAGGLYLYAASANRTTGTLTAFWGNPVAIIDNTGAAAFVGNVTGYDFHASRDATHGYIGMGGDNSAYFYRNGSDQLQIVSNNAYAAIFSSTLWTFYGDVNTPKGIIGNYNSSYRRRLYAMGSSFAGTADSSGNITSFSGYYGLTFAYDATSGGSNLTGLGLGHGVELNINGNFKSYWGDGGMYHASGFYVPDGIGMYNNAGGSAVFNGSYLRYRASTSSTTVTGMQFYTGDGSFSGYIYGTNGGYFGLLNNAGNWMVQLAPSGGINQFYNTWNFGTNAQIQTYQIATVQYGNAAPTGGTAGIVGQLFIVY